MKKIINVPSKKFVVYVLYIDKIVVYVGYTKNIFVRLNQHKTRKQFNSYQILFETDEKNEALFFEQKLIKLYEDTITNKSRPDTNCFGIKHPIAREYALRDLEKLRLLKKSQDQIDNKTTKPIYKILRENNLSRNVYYAFKKTQKLTSNKHKITDEVLRYILKNKGLTGKDLKFEVANQFKMNLSISTINKYKKKKLNISP